MLWDFTKCSICSGLRSTRVVLQLACRGDEVRPDLWSKKQKKKEYFLKKAHPSHSSQLSSSPPCRALPHLLRGYSKTARKQVLAKKLHQVGQTLKKLHKGGQGQDGHFMLQRNPEQLLTSETIQALIKACISRGDSGIKMKMPTQPHKTPLQLHQQRHSEGN